MPKGPAISRGTFPVIISIILEKINLIIFPVAIIPFKNAENILIFSTDTSKVIPINPFL